MQYFLKVLVHHVNHSVAESPQSKQQDKEEKGEQDVLAVSVTNMPFLVVLLVFILGGTVDD